MSNNTRSKSQQKADEKYKQKVYIFSVGICAKCKEEIDVYCKENGMTKKDFIEKAVYYYIDNH